MFAIYLSCLALGGALTLLSIYGRATGRAWRDHAADGPIYSLGSLAYSIFGFGAAGVALSRFGTGLGAGLEITFAVLAGLLVGGCASAALALATRRGGPSNRTTEGT
ncbi:MAG: hypothetical protein R3195_09455 [Gemmatimonadota bacterium]|nr:hypothetical protein [Gemmatimonadota bacterium]